jgi:transposase InsO family protein
MNMAYTNNPNIPEVRLQAVNLVKYHGWSTRKTALHFGYNHSTIVRWCSRKPVYGKYGRLVIPTLSSRPCSHPRQLSEELIGHILDIRQERNQCAELIHHRLNKEGILVSLSSVKRVLRRNGCTRYSKWKKWHRYQDRPLALMPGNLVEIDSILDGRAKERLSVYALIDVFSRWAFALPISQPNSRLSSLFVLRAIKEAPFSFQTLQSDHGSEFSKWFTRVVEHQGIDHRHSRVRRPTDNGHVERFNQTLQRECLNRVPRSMRSWEREIPEYIRYYNHERPHMALNYKTPMEVVQSY